MHLSFETHRKDLRLGITQRNPKPFCVRSCQVLQLPMKAKPHATKVDVYQVYSIKCPVKIHASTQFNVLICYNPRLSDQWITIGSKWLTQNGPYHLRVVILEAAPYGEFLKPSQRQVTSPKAMVCVARLHVVLQSSSLMLGRPLRRWHGWHFLAFAGKARGVSASCQLAHFVDRNQQGGQGLCSASEMATRF